HEVVRVGDAVAPHQRGDGLAGQVHVGHRDREREAPVTHPDLVGEGPLLRLPQRAPVAKGQHAHGLGPDVVPGAGVLLARVAQPDREEVGRGAAPLGRATPPAEHQPSSPPAAPSPPSAGASPPAASASPAGASAPSAASAPSSASASSPSGTRSASDTPCWPDTTASSGSTGVVTPGGSSMSATRRVW